MSEASSRYLTKPIEPADARAGFSCGKHALDDYFARHAVSNDAAGIGRAYVLRRDDRDDATPALLRCYAVGLAFAMRSSSVATKRLSMRPSATPIVSA